MTAQGGLHCTAQGTPDRSTAAEHHASDRPPFLVSLCHWQSRLLVSWVSTYTESNPQQCCWCSCCNKECLTIAKLADGHDTLVQEQQVEYNTGFKLQHREQKVLEMMVLVQEDYEEMCWNELQPSSHRPIGWTLHKCLCVQVWKCSLMVTVTEINICIP